MKDKEFLWPSFRNAFATLAYVAFISLFLFNGGHLFGNGKSFVIPIMMLLLLIISASVTGGLVLGKPILLYWDGKKREAILLFITTILWLFIFAIIAAMTLIIKAM